MRPVAACRSRAARRLPRARGYTQLAPATGVTPQWLGWAAAGSAGGPKPGRTSFIVKLDRPLFGIVSMVGGDASRSGRSGFRFGNLHVETSEGDALTILYEADQGIGDATAVITTVEHSNKMAHTT